MKIEKNQRNSLSELHDTGTNNRGNYSILVKFRALFADFRFKKRIKQLIRVPSHA